VNPLFSHTSPSSSTLTNVRAGTYPRKSHQPVSFFCRRNYLCLVWHPLPEDIANIRLRLSPFQGTICCIHLLTWCQRFRLPISACHLGPLSCPFRGTFKPYVSCKESDPNSSIPPSTTFGFISKVKALLP